MTEARDTLLAAAADALRAVDSIGCVYDSPPLQAALPYALLTIDLETDWGHKSAAGRELRLAANLFDKGERPERLRGLLGEAEAALAGISGAIGGWQIATMVLLRTRIVRGRDGVWAGIVEYRARLLAAG